MEVISKVIPYKRPDKFRIYPIGDIHLGVVHCDEDSLIKTVSEIQKDKNAYWIGMGDYADLVMPNDFKRWEGKILAPWMKDHVDNIGPTQLRRVDEILSPIWDKCLGLIEGNHDDNIRRYHNYNFMEELLILANKKGEVPYGGVSCFVRLLFKRTHAGEKGETHEYIIHARHGEGSARTSGARALAVLRLSQSMVNAHITLMGHLHGQEAPDIPQRILCKGGKIKSFETIATMTGAWIRAYMQGVPPCYLERWGTPPSTLGCPVLTIEPDKNRMELKKVRTIREL
uniref:Calcineurin-like phosphoesterase n=1 Tax=viral metagenome TaxID=1070528 RepID=A0A6M3KAW4_9ZZZZ